MFLIPRDLSKPMVDVTVDSHFNFHYGNAFEDEATGEVRCLIRLGLSAAVIGSALLSRSKAFSGLLLAVFPESP
jgi:hypothetical protein